MIDVFISRPTWVSKKFEEGLNNFLSFLDTFELRPRTIGKTDYPVDCPLDEVMKLLNECQGMIVLGYPQMILETGSVKDEPVENLLLPTEWNHIEASLAYSNKLPLLIIHHIGINRGVFYHGAISKFIYEKDLANSIWFLSDNIKGAFKTWNDLVIANDKHLKHISSSSPFDPMDNDFDSLSNILTKLSDTNILWDPKGKKPVTVNMYDLFYSLRNKLITGIPNHSQISMLTKHLYYYICPTFVSHGLVVKERSPQNRFSVFVLSDKGTKYMAYLDKILTINGESL